MSNAPAYFHGTSLINLATRSPASEVQGTTAAMIFAKLAETRQNVHDNKNKFCLSQGTRHPGFMANTPTETYACISLRKAHLKAPEAAFVVYALTHGGIGHSQTWRSFKFRLCFGGSLSSGSGMQLIFSYSKCQSPSFKIQEATPPTLCNHTDRGDLTGGCAGPYPRGRVAVKPGGATQTPQMSRGFFDNTPLHPAPLAIARGRRHV